MGAGLGAIACSTVLGIEEAVLRCAPGACDAGAPSTVIAAPPSAVGLQGPDPASAAVGDRANSPSAEPTRPVGVSASPSELSPSELSPSELSPSELIGAPLAEGDAGVREPPSGSLASDPTPSAPSAPGPVPSSAPVRPPLDANGFAVVTFTIDRAPGPIGFSYRGVPAGPLGAEDQLVRSDGIAQGARNSLSADLPGPVEWVYIADTAAKRALILMQHTDDALAETYQVRDNDSAAWVFGGGQITALPIRFSLSLIDSAVHAVVSQRAAYIAGAIH
jgi:hypothetical protein